MIVVVVVLLVGGFVVWEAASSNNDNQANTESIEQIEMLPGNLDTLKSLDEIEEIAEAGDGVSVISFVLETKDGRTVYKIILSNGQKLEIDAVTGETLSQETTDVSEDDKIPARVDINISPSQAYQKASSKSSSEIKSVEMEVEDTKVVYKIEFEDGSKIEIDATTGNIVKSEIKHKSKSEDNEDEHEDEHEEEDEEDNS